MDTPNKKYYQITQTQKIELRNSYKIQDFNKFYENNSHAFTVLGISSSNKYYSNEDLQNQKKVSTPKRNSKCFFCCFKTKKVQKEKTNSINMEKECELRKIRIKSQSKQENSISKITTQAQLYNFLIQTENIESEKDSDRKSLDSYESEVSISVENTTIIKSATCESTRLLFRSFSEMVIPSNVFVTTLKFQPRSKSDQSNLQTDQSQGDDFLSKPTKLISPGRKSIPQSDKNNLFYFCLEENPNNCNKCKELKEKNIEFPRIYNLCIHKLKLLNDKSTSEDILLAIVDEADEKNLFRITMEEEVDFINQKFVAHHPYLQRIMNTAEHYGLGDRHVYFSLFPTQFLQDDPAFAFFYENKIIDKNSYVFNIGDNEGVAIISAEDSFEHIFLFGGILRGTRFKKSKN
jgi:hypothetical protein